MDMNLADWEAGKISKAGNSPFGFTDEEKNNYRVEMDWGSDTSNSHPGDFVYEHLGGSATVHLTRPSRANINTPPQIDNEFNDYDSSDNIDRNYSDEIPIHAPVQTTSANLASRKSGASHLRQDHTAAPTRPRPQHTRSTSTTRDALSEHTVSPTPEISTAPRALNLSAMPDESEVMAQMALARAVLDQTKAMNNTAIDENIDPNLPPTPTTTAPQGTRTTIDENVDPNLSPTPTTTAPQGTRTTIDRNIDPNLLPTPTTTPQSMGSAIETSFDRESIQPVLLDGNQVQAKETLNSELDPSANHYQPSTRGPFRPPRLESSKDNTEVEGGTQSARWRRSNTALSRTQHGGNSSYAGSVSSASSSTSEKCVLGDPVLSGKLFELIEDLRKHHSGPEGLLEIMVRDAIIKFYQNHAKVRPPKVKERLLERISDCGVAKAALIVDWIDQVYAKAERLLNSGIPEERSANEPILVAHSPPSLSRPNGRISANHPPGGKRRPKSQNGTPPPVKRPRQNSPQQSINSAPPPKSFTSGSPSQTTKRFDCDLCGKEFQELRKWKRHYNTHLPRFFWACIFSNCAFVAVSSVDISQHYKGRHQRNDLSDPNFKQLVQMNKFVIPDGGHERCIYCDTEFIGTDGGRDSHISTEHIAKHFKDMTAEARSDTYEHCCTDRGDGQKCGAKHYWKSSRFLLPENRIRASVEDGTEATSIGDDSEGGDGEDGQGPGGSVPHGDGGSGGMGRGNGGRNGGGNGGGMGGSSRRGNGGGMGGGNSGGWSGQGMGGGRNGKGMRGRNNETLSGSKRRRRRGRSRSVGGENGSVNEGGRKTESFSTTIRYSSRKYGASTRALQATTTDLHSLSLPGSSSADLKYSLNSYLDTTNYGAGNHFTPSKSNVPTHEGWMRWHLNAILDPLEYSTG